MGNFLENLEHLVESPNYSVILHVILYFKF